MPFHPSKKEVARALAILGGGRAAQIVTQSAVATRRAIQAEGIGATALRGGRFVGRQAITKNPWGVAALLAYEGYVRRDEILDVAESLGGTMLEAMEFYQEATGQPPYLGGPQLGHRLAPSYTGFPRKRKISKANKAVKQGMKILKAGGKATTGSPAGQLMKGAFKIATKAAGYANPSSKSSVPKGTSVTAKLARKLKTWW